MTTIVKALVYFSYLCKYRCEIIQNRIFLVLCVHQLRHYVPPNLCEIKGYPHKYIWWKFCTILVTCALFFSPPSDSYLWLFVWQSYAVRYGLKCSVSIPASDLVYLKIGVMMMLQAQNQVTLSWLCFVFV